MENPIEHLKKSAQEIRLSREASERIRTRLEMHMREHPAGARMHSPYQRFFIRSPFMPLLRQPVAALAVLLIIGFGGATTYAATGALPGEPLYPVKVSVIEPVKGFLAVTPEGKAAWHATIAETRVSEVEQLVAEEKLTPERGAQVQKRFDRSIEQARENIEKLSKEHPQAAATIEETLVSRLDAREDKLNAAAAAATSTNASEARSFADHMKKKVHGKGKGEPDDEGVQKGEIGTPDVPVATSTEATSTPDKKNQR